MDNTFREVSRASSRAEKLQWCVYGHYWATDLLKAVVYPFQSSLVLPERRVNSVSQPDVIAWPYLATAHSLYQRVHACLSGIRIEFIPASFADMWPTYRCRWFSLHVAYAISLWMVKSRRRRRLQKCTNLHFMEKVLDHTRQIK